MDDKNDETRPNYKISESARRAKLNFLSSNVRPTYTTIWETITIEESISEGGNTCVIERIPFDLGGEYSRATPDDGAKNEESSRTTGGPAFSESRTGDPVYSKSKIGDPTSRPQIADSVHRKPQTGDTYGRPQMGDSTFSRPQIGDPAYDQPQSDQRQSGHESPTAEERALQRPSTTDLMFDSSRPSTSNDQLPSSTKSLSPKHLSRAAVFNEHSLRSRQNRNLQFKLDDEKLDEEHLDNLDNLNFGDENVHSDQFGATSTAKSDVGAHNYGALTDDFEKFKNNRSLSPTDRQLAKWLAIKRFKEMYRNDRPDGGRPIGSTEQSWPERNLSGAPWLEQQWYLEDQQRHPADPQRYPADQQRYPAVDQRHLSDQQHAASEQPPGQQVEQSPSPYKLATPDEVNDQNLFDSSSEQSGEQIPLEISDYYGSLEESNTRLTDREDDEFDDHLVNLEGNLEGNLESNPEDELGRDRSRKDFLRDEQRDSELPENSDKQRKTDFQRDLQNQIKLRNQRVQRSSLKETDKQPADRLSEQAIRIDLESDQERTPRASRASSTVVSEHNFEHNFIDTDDPPPFIYEQYLEAAKPSRPERTKDTQQSKDNQQAGAGIEEEFDKLFLDYPEIDKFLNSPTNSVTKDVLVNIPSPAQSPAHSPAHPPAHLSAHSPVRSPLESPVRLLVHPPLDSPNSRPIRSPIRSPHQPVAYPISYDQHLNNYQSPNEEPLFDQQFALERPFPSEILEIEEPLIISRNSSRQQSTPSIRQSVKRRSVVVQTSRPTSLMTNDGDDEIKHLLTITKQDKLTACYPIKDVYVINRTIYQIQKLSSFVLEFRNQLALIRGKLKRRAFPAMDENPEDAQPTEKAKEESKWNSFKLILKWTIANLFTTPGLAFILVCYCLIGAFLFKILERENNLREIRQMTKYRNETVYSLLQLNSRSLSKNEFVHEAEQILRVFEDEVIEKVEMNGYSGNATDKWDLSDSFLYAVTVISTIGYGKLSPKTFAGQLVTILYAVFGIPIMLLFITNLGTIMASIFRVSYDTICCYLCNLGKEEEELNQDSSNPPVTVSEQLATDPKTVDATESKANKKKASVSQPQPEQANTGDTDQSGVRTQDQNLETEDSIVVFQNNEYHTNVRERAYYLTFNGEPIHKNRVPIRIVVLIVICYICLGGLLFSVWESNDDKDGGTGSDFFKWAYFCFITLSTIGFGDIIPSVSVSYRDSEQGYFEGTAQILFCCVYLVFGLALIAMSFNLMQEQVILKMRKICESLGMDVRKRTLTY